MKINEIEFDVKPLNRSQRKELRAKGFSLLEKAKIHGEKAKLLKPDEDIGLSVMPFDEAEMDDLLAVAFKGIEKELDQIGFMVQVHLASEVFLACIDNPAKKS